VVYQNPSNCASALGKQQRGRQKECLFKDEVQLNVGFRNDKISHIWAALPFLGASPNFRTYTKKE
jgi:hypothetical protein